RRFVVVRRFQLAWSDVRPIRGAVPAAGKRQGSGEAERRAAEIVRNRGQRPPAYYRVHDARSRAVYRLALSERKLPCNQPFEHVRNVVIGDRLLELEIVIIQR